MAIIASPMVNISSDTVCSCVWGSSILFFLDFLVFYFLIFLVFFCAFSPFFFKDFRGSAKRKTLAFGGFPCFLSKRTRVGGSGRMTSFFSDLWAFWES